jgi:hypothetical protein
MKKLLPFVLFVLLLQACSPYKESTGVWVNKEKFQGKSYGNIFIIVIIVAKITDFIIFNILNICAIVEIIPNSNKIAVKCAIDVVN